MAAFDTDRFSRQIRFAPPAGYPGDEAIEREILYNRVRPSRLAWWRPGNHHLAPVASDDTTQNQDTLLRAREAGPLRTTPP